MCIEKCHLKVFSVTSDVTSTSTTTLILNFHDITYASCLASSIQDAMLFSSAVESHLFMILIMNTAPTEKLIQHCASKALLISGWNQIMSHLNLYLKGIVA